MPNDNIVYVFMCKGIRSWRLCGQTLPVGISPEAVITRHPWRASIHDDPGMVLPSDPCKYGTFADSGTWKHRSLRQYCRDLREHFATTPRAEVEAFARVASRELEQDPHGDGGAHDSADI